MPVYYAAAEQFQQFAMTQTPAGAVPLTAKLNGNPNASNVNRFLHTQILALADDGKKIPRPPVALPSPVHTRGQNPRLNRAKSLQPQYAETLPPKRIL